MSSHPLSIYHQTIQLAGSNIEQALHRNDAVLPEVLKLLSACRGKYVIAGIGKSFIISQKMAATFSSTGSPAVALHAGEAFHGDLGICAEGDVAIIISKSGTTAELVKLVPVFKSFGIKVIGILGNLISPIAGICDYVLDASVSREADSYNLVPTSSTSVALAIGDALAITLMEDKKFSREDFARYHPGGQLGKNLLHAVAHHMHKTELVALAKTYTPLKEIIVSMTEKPLGIACVTDEEHRLLGIITDGDIRRFFVKHDDIKNFTAADIMTEMPVSISPEDNIMQALELMESRNSKLSVLPVVADNKLAGIIRIHDIY